MTRTTNLKPRLTPRWAKDQGDPNEVVAVKEVKKVTIEQTLNSNWTWRVS